MNFVEKPNKGDLVYYLGGKKPYLVIIVGESYRGNSRGKTTFPCYSWIRILSDGGLGAREDGEGVFGHFDGEYELVTKVVFKQSKGVKKYG